MKITLYCVVVYYSTRLDNYDVQRKWFRTEEKAKAFQASRDYVRTELTTRSFESYEEALDFFMYC